MVCEEVVVLRLGVGVGVSVIVELLDTLEDALVLWDGPVDIDTLELKLNDVDVDAVAGTLDVEDAVVDTSVL